MLRQRVVQRVHAHPVGVERNADHLQAMIAEQLERQKIGGLFHEDRVAGFGEPRAHQIERLRRAGRYHEVSGIHGRGVASTQELRQRFAKPVVALIGTVLQQRSIASRQAVLGCCAHRRLREQRERRLAVAEVDVPGARHACSRGHDGVVRVAKRLRSLR